MPVNSYQAAPAKGVICQTGSRTSVMIANVQEKALSVAHNNQSQTSARSSSPRLSGNNVSSPHASPRGGSFKAPQRPRTDRSCTESSTCEAQTIELLAKTCFTCTLVGDRQSGKRTIVKCFIKLLNEFKLASQEYRREKMLAKLLDCSERLQTLSIPTHSGQHKSKASDSALGSPAKVSPRARVNSWFAEGKKLLNLSVKANKSRLDPISAGRLTSPGQLASQHQQKPTGSANLVEHIPVDQSGNQYEQPSRSRALALEVADTDPQLLETTSFRSPSGSVSDNSGSCDSSSICSSTGSGPSSLELSAQASKSIINRRSRLDDCNKSDFNINYHADRVSADTSRASRALEGRWADNSKLTVTGVTLGQRRSLNERYLADSSLDSLSRDGKLGASTNSLIVNRNRSEPEPAPQPNQFEYNDTISKPNRIPRISLKQLNKRRYKVKFSTRRLLSSKYLLDTPTGAKAKLPDCFMVVYAINDRESFEYARYLISQLRSLKLHSPLPIILVANKVDLERAKVVRSEEGRSLAIKSRCKFMETSCTVGFNLDNLLVGLRTQLVLKQHADFKNCRVPRKLDSGDIKIQKTQETPESKKSGILMRFYRKCIADKQENYDCANFSKL